TSQHFVNTFEPLRHIHLYDVSLAIDLSLVKVLLILMFGCQEHMLFRSSAIPAIDSSIVKMLSMTTFETLRHMYLSGVILAISLLMVKMLLIVTFENHKHTLYHIDAIPATGLLLVRLLLMLTFETPRHTDPFDAILATILSIDKMLLINTFETLRHIDLLDAILAIGLLIIKMLLISIFETLRHTYLSDVISAISLLIRKMLLLITTFGSCKHTTYRFNAILAISLLIVKTLLIVIFEKLKHTLYHLDAIPAVGLLLVKMLLIVIFDTLRHMLYRFDAIPAIGLSIVKMLLIPISKNPELIFQRSFPLFRYDPTLSSSESFAQLKSFHGWGRNDPEERSAWGRYQSALVEEVELWYGAEDDLDSWHSLCRSLGIQPLPVTCGQGVRRTRGLFVNIIDLIEWARSENQNIPVRRFPNLQVLREYSRRTNRIFPSSSLDEYHGGNVVLRHLLRFIYRGSYSAFYR
ncbi:hypothetical protein N7475_009966, partial [Penicillium sp. IBT 31633x]